MSTSLPDFLASMRVQRDAASEAKDLEALKNTVIDFMDIQLANFQEGEWAAEGLFPSRTMQPVRRD